MIVIIFCLIISSFIRSPEWVAPLYLYLRLTNHRTPSHRRFSSLSISHVDNSLRFNEVQVSKITWCLRWTQWIVSDTRSCVESTLHGVPADSRIPTKPPPNHRNVLRKDFLTPNSKWILHVVRSFLGRNGNFTVHSVRWHNPLL